MRSISGQSSLASRIPIDLTNESSDYDPVASCVSTSWSLLPPISCTEQHLTFVGDPVR